MQGLNPLTAAIYSPGDMYSRLLIQQDGPLNTHCTCLCESTSLRHQTQGSPCGRCSVPVCSVSPPAWDSQWCDDQDHRSMNNQLLLFTETNVQLMGQSNQNQIYLNQATKIR